VFWFIQDMSMLSCNIYTLYRCSFEFILKVGVEESIVNAPLARLQSKNTNDAKSDVKFKQRQLWG
jgi:hypothetical protein